MRLRRSIIRRRWTASILELYDYILVGKYAKNLGRIEPALLRFVVTVGSYEV